MKPPVPHKLFRSAKTEAKQATKRKGPSTSYRLAFLDPDFLLRRSLRSVRLQLELLKPELALQDEHIESTVVVFGSARIQSPRTAKAEFTLAKEALAISPNKPQLKRNLEKAKAQLEKSKYYEEARKLAALISSDCQKEQQRQFVIVTGGGPGIMQAANQGAYDVKAKSIGLNIVLPQEQGPNPYISPELCFQFHYFAIRKMHFLIRARALVCFPGGYGTLDELFETLTLLQTKKIRPMPLLLFGKEYWSRLINFDMLVDEGMISPEDLRYFQYVETAEEAWQQISVFYKNPAKIKPKKKGKN